MKLIHPKTCVVLAAVAAGVIGCSSQHTRTANESINVRNGAVTSIDDTKKDLAQADQQLSLTHASWVNLVNYQGDLQPAYGRFTDDVEKTKTIDSKLGSDVNHIADRTVQYTADWNYKSQSIYDGNMRNDSLSRQATAKQEQDQVIAGVNDFRATYLDYIHRLEDVQAYAGSDLTAQGMQNLRNHTQGLQNAENAVKQKLAHLNGTLTQVADAWRSSAIPAIGQPATPAQPIPAGATMEPATTPTTVRSAQ
jgi:hypothetical protein